MVLMNSSTGIDDGENLVTNSDTARAAAAVVVVTVIAGLAVQVGILGRHLQCVRRQTAALTNIEVAHSDVDIVEARQAQQFAMWIGDRDNGEPANSESLKAAAADTAAARGALATVYRDNPPPDC